MGIVDGCYSLLRFPLGAGGGGEGWLGWLGGWRRKGERMRKRRGSLGALISTILLFGFGAQWKGRGQRMKLFR